MGRRSLIDTAKLNDDDPPTSLVPVAHVVYLGDSIDRAHMARDVSASSGGKL
jgi:phosphoglycolate phosphatase-like HAD superfamily hydrolase